MAGSRRLQSLLQTRICDLPLSLDQGPLAAQVRVLYRDLARAGLSQFRPKVYFGDEWFSPEGLAAIALPFWLASPELARVEAHYMREVEGGRPEWCRKLLRHEAGHCFDHAFKVSRTASWRQVFGRKPRVYDPDAYRADPTSRAYVRHLPGHYAQAHPDEDFAETFAVCITPGSSWQAKYADWPEALEKLLYVQDLIRRYSDSVSPRWDSPLCYDARRMRMTVGRYYERRMAERERLERRVKRLTKPAHLAERAARG